MKKILIIGATSAIAQEVAKIYAAAGSDFALIGRNPEMLEIISQDLTARGAKKVLNIAHDLNDLSAHESIIENSVKHLGQIDIAILAHGILGNQEKAENDTSELLNILNSNFLSHTSLLMHISKEMAQQRAGTIAVISSVAGDRGKQSNYIYGSAMAGKTAFTDGLRNRLFAKGVHVITIKLGFVDTPMTEDFKKGPLWASSLQVARGIQSAIEKQKDTVYLPFFWRFIMLIIRNVPERIFKKLKL